ncbi:osmotically-inducible protein OsmY [Granulicella aggregans]|uniref:Osmotically-inducible protein OsmY n=1 Tax=Granulicella aggregans TaxID=474949 RepID=A0A7W7ZIK8_9BACT|nr:BON domain-containing protein [Granulicella aggregans]MBB5060624.1 osmotically-inducible protein OsmY [Granulicella aggregans]
MKNLILKVAAPAAFVLLVAAHSGYPQTAVDDSVHNKGQKTTADSQSNAKSDRLTTAKVRRAIIADKGLSMYAHNVKIITLNGAVTLKGPVKSEEEKQKVAADAAGATSADAITNQLTIK